jgi:hypothetical protein
MKDLKMVNYIPQTSRVINPSSSRVTNPWGRSRVYMSLYIEDVHWYPSIMRFIQVKSAKQNIRELSKKLHNKGQSSFKD